MSVLGNTSLSFSAEQAMILASATEFCQRSAPIDSVRNYLNSSQGYNEALWGEMTALGWPAIAIPEAYGGSGLSLAALVPILEAMGKSLLSGPLMSTALAAQLVLRTASASQQEHLLPKIVAGAKLSVAHLESADWAEGSIHCDLSEDFSLSGDKYLVTDVTEHGGVDYLLVSALRGNMPVIVCLDADQLQASTIQVHQLIDETKRASTLHFKQLMIRQEQVFATDGVEAALGEYQLLGALLVAAEAVGSTASCLQTITEYLKTRKQFDRLIGSYQALKHPTVEILTSLDSARSLLYHAATVLEGETSTRPSQDLREACHMAKAQATEALIFAGDRAVQFHGGMGFTYDCDAQLFIRRAQWAQQQFGDACYHRQQLATLLFD